LSKGCQKVVKKLPKSCQKVVKQLSKSCQKNVKVVKKLSKFKTSGEDDDGDDDEEEEEDWCLQDFVAPGKNMLQKWLHKAFWDFSNIIGRLTSYCIFSELL
jgi:hypothetical protein